MIVSVEIWLAFVLASGVMLAIPGPTVLLVVGIALAEGRRYTWSVVTGVVLGDFTAMSLSLAGLGVILSASIAAFTVMKWIGAAYLIYLGVRMWLREAPLPSAARTEKLPASHWAMMGRAYTVTTLNPKGLVFFVAFMPQFITPASPVFPQLLLLGGTFLFLALLNATAYALLAGGFRNFIMRRGVLRTVNRVGGTLLIGAGVLTAALKRS